MDGPTRAIEWEAPAHHHVEKGDDWFWALGIIVFSMATAAFFFGNFLFALLIMIAGGLIALVANREPALTFYAVTPRGLRIDDRLYPYSTLEAFYIDEEDPHGPQLLARSKQMLAHMIVMPIPEEKIETIESILEGRLPEEHLEEPLATKILEIFGF